MARDFNGTTDRIDYASAFDMTGQAITISCWAWFDAFTPAANKYLFNSAISGGGAGVVFQQQGANDGMLSFFRDGTTFLNRISTSSVVATTAWYHLCVTHDGVFTTSSSIHIYRNGTEVSYLSGQNGATETTANSGFSIGGRTSDDLRNHDGRIAEMGIWNRVISAGEIRALSRGLKPNHFPYLLKFYAPLIRDPNDVRGLTATLDGTTVIAHPRMLRRIITCRATGNPSASAPALWSIATGMRW